MTRLLRLVVALAAFVPTATGASQHPTYIVERVIDGDTVVLSSLGTVRLIGVDTPETVDPRQPVQQYGLESAAFLKQLAQGRSVRVEYDRQRLDKYRRTLAYLYLPDGVFVNLEIIRQGFGHAYSDYPFAHLERFRDAEREAREASRGLWADDQTASPVKASTDPARVWVNTSSKVYHCPGTRYYGTTVRGSYMSETAAKLEGYRPAYGRECGPLNAGAVKTAPVGSAKANLVTPPPAPAPIRVWVNTSSGVYHCPGTRYYGTTKKGVYLEQSAAQAAGHRPAGGNACS